MGTVDQGLRELIARGFRFQHLRDAHGELAVIIGSYGWGECYDRIQLYGESSAVAARALVDSPGDEVMWSYEGDALSTMRALLELPKPHEPGAPRASKRGPSGLWLPDNVTDPRRPR